MNKWLNKFHCGDCIELMWRMPEGSVDLVVTSPPYNLALKPKSVSKWQNNALIDGYGNHDDCMPHDEYVSWQRDCLKAMLRLLPDTGAIFYVHKCRVQKGLLQDRHDILNGFPVRQRIVWRRSGGLNFNEQYFLPTYEDIYLIAKPGFKLAPNRLTDVWQVPQEMNNKHPAPFPLQIPQRCIHSTKARVILDPFMGSGTTAIAAHGLNRQWIGIDNCEEYCEMARARYRKETMQIEIDCG